MPVFQKEIIGMYCRQCGNEVADNCKYCGRCGYEIHKKVIIENSPPMQNSPPKNKTLAKIKEKKLIILIAAVLLLITLILIPIISCSINSLESKLTRHTWYCDNNGQTLEFYKNGTYIRTLRSGTTKDGRWSINGNQLKMGSKTYSWWDNLDDRSIANHTVGYKYYSWYVSDRYFVRDDDCIYGMDSAVIFEAE